MKKIMIVLCFIVAFAMISTSVFAAAITDAGYYTGANTFGTATPLSISTSKNVFLSLSLGNTSAPVNNYVLGAYHQTGSRTFSSANFDTKIYYQDTTGVVAPTADNASPTTKTYTGTAWIPL